MSDSSGSCGDKRSSVVGERMGKTPGLLKTGWVCRGGVLSGWCLEDRGHCKELTRMLVSPMTSDRHGGCSIGKLLRVGGVALHILHRVGGQCRERVRARCCPPTPRFFFGPPSPS